MSAEIEIAIHVSRKPGDRVVEDIKKEITYVINDHLKGFRCTNWRGKTKPTQTVHYPLNGYQIAGVIVTIRCDCKSTDEFMETFSDFINQTKQIEGFQTLMIQFTNTVTVTA
jgi:hypothetical protein